ncbi:MULTISPECIES: TetR/AcrR family transcriptional regulator [Mumia]|uniref:TetR/AcrR family transcriptional regulator n=1 Tax=Mumia TaxID=1546255 RepID=UPI0014211F5F|nr:MULTISPECIES: TetR family transcriptional regulator [unclassified Mumia]QMW66312.1 TetR family transcriptional regulator [Mumia sp. ZJ1417]
MSRPRSRREQYSDETREALLTTAAGLFAERGFAKTALSEVASAAQVTRGAVYHHFKDKQDLYRAVLERTETDGMAAIREAYLVHEDPVAGALAAMNAYLDHAVDSDYAEIVLRQGPIALGWEEWKACEEQYAAGLIEQIITALVSAGRLPPLPIATTAAITFTMLGGCGMALAAAAPEDRPRVKDECSEVLARLVAGLLV